VEDVDMSKSRDLLLECQKVLGGVSAYQLSKRMEIHSARISAYLAEKEIPDEYACVRIAEILNRTPEEIIAIVQVDTTKNIKRRTFWAQKLYQLAEIESTLWKYVDRDVLELLNLKKPKMQAAAKTKVESGSEKKSVENIFRGKKE
jgi:plasmid maintenance system antidote protein VapI